MDKLSETLAAERDEEEDEEEKNTQRAAMLSRRQSVRRLSGLYDFSSEDIDEAGPVPSQDINEFSSDEKSLEVENPVVVEGEVMKKGRKLGAYKSCFIRIDVDRRSFSCFKTSPNNADAKPSVYLGPREWKVQDVIDNDSHFYIIEVDKEESKVEQAHPRKTKARKHKFRCPNGGNEKLRYLLTVELIEVELQGIKNGNNWFAIAVGRSRIRNVALAAKINMDEQLKGVRRRAERIMEITCPGAPNFTVRTLRGRPDPQDVSADEKIPMLKAFPEDEYPHRWLTIEELYGEMRKPAKRIEDLRNDTHSSLAQSGKPVGYLFIEVLTCFSLRKRRPRATKLRIPPCSVQFVCGDHSFTTEEVPVDINPVWLCRAKRAAIFPVYHAFGRVYVGVWHRYPSSDDLVGRVIIDIPYLRPDSQYDVVLPLRGPSDCFDRIHRGGIRMRFELHWTDEREAILSYPRNILRPAKAVIPHDNERKFKSTAILVHGPSLKHHKYHNRGFLAMKRENKLYRQEIMKLARRTVKSTMNWEIPCVSAYVFSGWMMCVYFASVALVPPFLVGGVIMLFIRNYFHFMNDRMHFGFAPVSISEIFFALITRRKISSLALAGTRRKIQNYVEPNHMEFPFSDSTIAPRLSAEDVTSAGRIEGDIGKNLKTGDGVDYDFDDDMSDDSGAGDPVLDQSGVSSYVFRQASTRALQNVTKTGGKGKSVIKDLEEIEQKYDKATFNLFKEEIYEGQHSEEDNINKLLRLGEFSKNPFLALKQKHFVPITRILHKINSGFRLLFNIFAWKDHYLSFWVLSFLCGLMAVLLLFPWRLFFFIMGALLFGPQNAVIGYCRKGFCVKQEVVSSSEDTTCSFSVCSSDSDDLARDCKLPSKDYKVESKVPKELIMPYGLVKRERFYDWPPDESVSKVAESKSTVVEAYPRKLGVHSIQLNKYKYKI